MLAAGHGLAAAHAAGLVHRDFKPDNILVGRDGRVRVGDFGLAAVEAVAPRGLIGTPAYMAHEQLVGGKADARSDQFSYAVVLYEACYGTRPFSGATVAALAAAIGRGPALVPPPGRTVPRHLRALLARALAADPAQRFPAMPDLLRELARDPERTRRRALVLAGAGVVIAAVAAIAGARASSSGDTCSGGGAELARAWDPARRADVTRAFAASGRPHLATTTATTVAALDAYGNRWRALHAGTCQAHRRGEISAAMLDRRMTCLARSRDALGALVGVFGTADGDVVDGALAAIGRLPHVDACATEPSTARVDPLVGELRALVDAGKYAAADERIAAVRAAAAASGDPATLAEVRLLEGELAIQLGRAAHAHEPLREAARRAGDARDDVTLARALVALVGLQVAEARYGDAESTALPAEVLAKRYGLQLELALALGDLRIGQGRYREAREHYTRALAAASTPLATITARAHLGKALAEHGFLADARTELQQAHASATQHLGSSHPTTARTAIQLGGVLARLDDDGGRALFDGALVTLETALGANHPYVADALDEIGVAAADRGDTEHARTLFERALAIRQGVARPDHPAIAASFDLIAGVRADAGELAEARAHHTRALELRRQALGAEHPEVASSLANLGRIAYYEAKYDDGKRLFDEALRVARSGDDQLLAATIRANRATLLLDLGEVATARDELRAALAMIEKQLGAAHPDAATIRSTLAATLEPTERREQLHRALEIRAAAFGDHHPDVARSHHELAAFLLELGETGSATTHAETAVRILDATLGAENVTTAVARLALASARRHAGALDAAGADAQRALTTLEHALGPDHPTVAGALAIAGSIDRLRGLGATARTRLERARTIYQSLGTEPERLADVERELAKLRGRRQRQPTSSPIE
jgi:tetratricopeptide (TPR) repeat protein